MAAGRKRSALKGRGGLIAVVAIIGLGIWFFADQKAPVVDPAAPKVAESVDIRAGDVTRVQVKRGDGGFTLARRDGRWGFEAPGKWSANAETVTSWLKGLLDDAAVSQRVEGAPGDLAKFGLDKPQVELVLTAQGKERSIQIGKDFRTPGQKTGTLFYARETGAGRMFMLSAGQVDDLRKKKADDLRDKRLVVVADEKSVKSITVTRGAEKLELIRKGDDRWALTQPFQAPADSGDASSLLSRIRNAEADTFVADAATDLAPYGLDHPLLTAELKTGNATVGIRFGRALKDGKVYAARLDGNEVTLVSKFTFTDLDSQARPARLRDRQLVSLDRDAIASIELKGPGGMVRLKKKGPEDWTLLDEPDPKKAKASADKVRQVLDRAVGTAAGFVEESPSNLARYGLDKPEISLTVTDARNTRQTLLIGKKAGADYYAKGPATAVFTVAKFFHDDLNLKPEDFAAKP